MKLTNTNNTFSFYITLSKGWTSPLFCVQDGYIFCIKYKEGRIASLILLKGKTDDNLKWPNDFQYRLEVLIERPHRNVFAVGEQSKTQIFNLDLSAKMKHIAKDDTCNGSMEAAGESLLNYNVIELSPIMKILSMNTTIVPKSIDSVPPRRCHYCGNTLISRAARVCATCGRSQSHPRNI